jgi:hypothetical protein
LRCGMVLRFQRSRGLAANSPSQPAAVAAGRPAGRRRPLCGRLRESPRESS